MKTFNELNIEANVLDALAKMGFETTTPIQAQAIPTALEGKDLIGQAQTGTGKTTAFGVPMIQKIDPENKDVQGIVIAPTRELAIQVGEELNRIGHNKGVKTVPIYGGQDITRQIKALKRRPQLITATPGRLLDHIRRRTIKLQNIETVVLDEADEMLNMGFIEDIEAILAEMPQKHQTLLFSATMPKRIQLLAEKFMNQPEIVRVKSKQLTVDHIDQYYYDVKENQKFDVLCRSLDIESPDLAIIFGRTKKRVDEVVEGLLKRGYSAEGIHGDIPQVKREKVIKRFKDQATDILVATDVAARGLDISGVTHVYNFDLPQDPESYVHRIGRTGRAGKKGSAYTFVTPREMDHLKTIEKLTKRQIEKQSFPTYKDVMEGLQEGAIEELKQTVWAHEGDNYREAAKRLLSEEDAVDVVASAIKLLAKEPSQTPVNLTSVEPLRVKRVKGGGQQNNRGGRGGNQNRRGGGGGGRRRRNNQKQDGGNRRNNRNKNQ
ncbi:DEAD/DEAH box helicase [Alkalibacillus haloalkaliphilus]|uniref:ATP-dependent RNA helicase CshA n=1 Tax=Alkalibacillus haloalkaliphilus TaxID=94136 RepID=A0A511W2J6_9BACI|nr:DEAD/DEAH box helicase [Alkalibacillus haloalkaliphilus]GEN44598.1 DEAD-box ATP-dependent RNA helicase CshA [Alkalibacillus haloalkaliphilus]